MMEVERKFNAPLALGVSIVIALALIGSLLLLTLNGCARPDPRGKEKLKRALRVF